MYINAAYLENTLVSPRTPLDQEDVINPLRVLCCGVYRIYSIPRLDTERPTGRKDYQLLYFHAGQGHFYFDGLEGEETIVHAGQMVLFRPGEPQMYYYYANDRTEVYWVHFTGNMAAELLKHYGFPDTGHIIKSGIYLDYQNIFLNMVTELQLARKGYEELLTLMLREILLLASRNRNEESTGTNMQKEIEKAIRFFNENYSTEIVIQDYVKGQYLSPCWFTKNFKQYTGYTPAQYLTSLRMSNARNLLENKNYQISEIASMVGYDDPLYFSRAFKKHVGYSPREYQKLYST